MRKLIGMAGALLLILPQVALAQDHHGGGGGGGGGHGGPPGGGGGGHGPGGGGGGPHFGGGGPGGGGEHHGGPPPGAFGGGGGRHGGGDVRPQGIPGGGDRHGGGDFRAQGRPGGPPAGSFASRNPGGFRGGDRGVPGAPGFRGNFPRSNNGWHRGFYAGQRGGWDRIRGGNYSYPRGWGYRRWGLGAILPGLLFGSAYYWNDYDTYGVYPPPYGDRWVRYGPDLLLINIRTGRVDDAIYGAFY